MVKVRTNSKGILRERVHKGILENVSEIIKDVIVVIVDGHDAIRKKDMHCTGVEVKIKNV